MNQEQTRASPPRHFGHDEHRLTDDMSGTSQRDQAFFQPPYVPSERYSNASVPSHYSSESFTERSVEPPGTVGSSNGFEQHTGPLSNSSYTFMAAPLHPSQVPTQARSSQFPMPASRGIHDISGQSCPPGGRPRVSTTIWEDEGTLCFQVEADQVTVARREGKLI